MTLLESWVLYPFLVSVTPSPLHSAFVPFSQAQVPHRSSAFRFSLHLSPTCLSMKGDSVLLEGHLEPLIGLLQPGPGGIDLSAQGSQ